MTEKGFFRILPAKHNFIGELMPVIDQISHQRKRQHTARYRVPNLERGLKILEALLDYPQGLQQSDIASLLGFAKTSVFRIVMTLVDYGYLEREEETKTIRLSRKMIAMGSRALAEEDLMATSVEIMRKLRDSIKETVLLGVIAETELVVLGQVLGSYPFKFSVDLGTRLPLHTAAPGKAILSWLPETECMEVAKKISFTRFNEKTITNVEQYIADLKAARKQGYALDCGEQLMGIHCVAAAVFNRHSYPIAAIWTTGPTDRLRHEDLPRVGKLVRDHAQMISNKLGYGLLQGIGHGNLHRSLQNETNK